MWVLLAAAASAHVPVVYYAGPEDDWCAVIAGTEGSDIVMLLPGEYTGPCDIHANLSDVASEQTFVQSFDPAEPARFVGSTADYVLSVGGEQLILFQLSFEGLPAGVDAVRVGDIRQLWLRWSWFRDLPGTVIRTVGVPQDLVVSDNELTDVGVAMVIGCPDGSCAVPTFEVSNNLVTRAGLGFDVAPGSAGRFADNVMVEVATGVRIGGAAGAVTLHGELYQGSGPLVDVVGGPASVVSSVLIADALAVRAAGVDVDLVGDTVLGPLELSGPGVRLVSSALDRPLPDGVEAPASVGCPDPAACFTDAAAWDLYPTPTSPLLGGGETHPAAFTDWCGRARPDPPTVGAFEVVGSASMGPLPTGFKDDFDCTLERDPDDTGTTTPGTNPTTPPGGTTDPTGPAGERPRDQGCGCAGGPPTALVGIFALAALIRTRSRR